MNRILFLLLSLCIISAAAMEEQPSKKQRTDSQSSIDYVALFDQTIGPVIQQQMQDTYHYHLSKRNNEGRTNPTLSAMEVALQGLGQSLYNNHNNLPNIEYLKSIGIITFLAISKCLIKFGHQHISLRNYDSYQKAVAEYLKIYFENDYKISTEKNLPHLSKLLIFCCTHRAYSVIQLIVSQWHIPVPNAVGKSIGKAAEFDHTDQDDRTFKNSLTIKCLRTVLAAGFDPNTTTRYVEYCHLYTWSPLQRAAQLEKSEWIGTLLWTGANPHYAELDSDGYAFDVLNRKIRLIRGPKENSDTEKMPPELNPELNRCQAMMQAYQNNAYANYHLILALRAQPKPTTYFSWLTRDHLEPLKNYMLQYEDHEFIEVPAREPMPQSH